MPPNVHNSMISIIGVENNQRIDFNIQWYNHIWKPYTAKQINELQQYPTMCMNPTKKILRTSARHKITYTDDCTEIKILKNPTTCNAFLDGEAIMKNQESDCHKTQDDGFLCRGESGQ